MLTTQSGVHQLQSQMILTFLPSPDVQYPSHSHSLWPSWFTTALPRAHVTQRTPPVDRNHKPCELIAFTLALLYKSVSNCAVRLPKLPIQFPSMQGVVVRMHVSCQDADQRGGISVKLYATTVRSLSRLHLHIFAG